MELSEMVLSDELKLKGLTRARLADIMGVSRKTVSRLGESVTTEVLEAISGYVSLSGDRVKEPDEYSREEILEICKRRGGLEADVNREKETDFEICESLGLKVFEFKRMLAAL